MVNTEIRQFRDSIIAITNASSLPMEIKRLVFSEVFNKINDESDRVIILEKQQQEKQEQEKESEENTNEQKDTV